MKTFIKHRFWIYVLSACFFLISFPGCASTKGSGEDKLDLRLKKNAMEERAAADALQHEEKKDAHPNYLALARTLAAKGFYDIALGQLKEAEKINDKNPEIFYLKGICLREKKQFKEAALRFERAVALDPEYSYAYAGLGSAYDMMGKRQRAVENYMTAISINPAIPSFYNNLGVSLMADGKVFEAVGNFKKSIALNPRFSRSVNNLGLAYGMLDMDDKALAMFKKSGDEAGAFNNMGYVYQMKGERKKAIEMYRKAIDLNPDFVVARKNLNKIVGEKRTTEY